MPCRFFYRLLIGIIHFIHAGRFFILGRADNFSFLKCDITDIDTIIRFIGYRLRNDVLRSLKRICCGLHSFFFTHIFFSLFFQRLSGFLRQNKPGKPVQSLLLGNTGSGPSFRPERTIKIFYHYQSLRRQNLGLKLLIQLSLFLYTRKNLFLLFFQIAKIVQPFKQITELFVIQRPGNLFPIPGNKGNCISLINQFDSRFNLPSFHL